MRWLRGGIALGGLLAASGLAFGQPATGGLGPGLAAGYITAVTQPAGDNSTKVATTAFVAGGLPSGTSSQIYVGTGVAGVLVPASAVPAAALATAIPSVATSAPECGTGAAGAVKACGSEMVLPNGTTATTPAAGTNATTVATTAFVAPMYSPIFGMGSDGALTCSSGTTTLTRGMQYTNVTISGSCQIVTANEPIQATGTCDLSAAPTAAIANNGPAGNSASGATVGSTIYLPGINSVGLMGSYSPLNATPLGGTGSTGIGANGAGSSTINSLGGGSPSAGSSGGAGSGYAGGTGGSQGATVLTTASLPISLLPWNTFSAGDGVFRSSVSGPAGGAGGGDGTNKGGAGGNGGFGGGNILLACRVISRGSNTNTSIIQAKGGNGGNGGLAAGGNAGGGGGGQGGGGGWVHIIAETLTGSQIANAVDISGGSAGNGGNGVGTGGGGLISAGSTAGGYQLDVISAPSSTMVVMPQGTTGRTIGTAPSGVTGGTGGIGATAQGAL